MHFGQKFMSSSKKGKREMNTKAKDNPLLKNWVIHNKEEGITTFIRYVSKGADGNYRIAVSRAFKSVNDRNTYSRPIGRTYAGYRMTRFYDQDRNRYRDGHNEMVVTKTRRDPESRKHSEIVIFAVGEENLLYPHEINVWHETILPQIERMLSF